MKLTLRQKSAESQYHGMNNAAGRILSNKMITPDYIVGLVDGEGSFTVYIKNPDDSTEFKRRARTEPNRNST